MSVPSANAAVNANGADEDTIANSGSSSKSQSNDIPAFAEKSMDLAYSPKSGRKSFQFRALGRKTLSYQRRQVFVNVCCIGLCPILMVVIAGAMGILITNLVNDLGTPANYLLCSDVDAMTPRGFPLVPSFSDQVVNFPTSPGSQIPNAKAGDTIKHVNWYIIPGNLGFGSSPTITADSCTWWFEKDYPYSSPYAKDPNITVPGANLDSTYKPQPQGGWLGPQQLMVPIELTTQQFYPWLLTADLTNGQAGTRPQQPQISIQSANLTGQPFGTGLLGSIDTRYFANITRTTQLPSISGFQLVPFYKDVGGTEDSVDDALTGQVQTLIKRLALVDKTAIRAQDPSPEQLIEYYSQIGSLIQDMPIGAVIFNAIDFVARKFDYTLQVGKDVRLSRAANYPKRGIRLMEQHTALVGAILKSSQKAATTKITHGFRGMPQLFSTKAELPIAALVGRILYPFGVSFLLPIFVITIVKEKEDRILVMMRMSGLKSITYYIAHYIHFYILHIISTFMFIIAGVAFKMPFFTLVQPGVYVLLFFFWGHVQIALAFFLSCFFSKSRTALVIVFLLVLCGVIVSLATESIFEDDKAPLGYFVWPAFAFYRALSVINRSSFDKSYQPYKISDLKGSDEVFQVIIAMIIETFVFLGLAFYLTEVFPTEYGVRQPWHFIFSTPYKFFFGKKDKKGMDIEGQVRRDNTGSARDIIQGEIPLDPEEVKFEDMDVKQERAQVLHDDYSPDCPLVLKNMRKIYPSNKKLAVKNVTFAVDKDTIFGLLGPNGAGKTSLIHILTGLYEPTQGWARLAGFELDTQIKDVYRNIGICPQHDILWDDLTVGEHLYFYARLKGVVAKDEYAAVQASLNAVSLVPFENRLTKGLSGGEKRRLSIAISLVGNPGIVFLDEPTTGLDISVRRLIWDIVQNAKQGRTIVLTTHSMEEAEVLCAKIGIMAKGTLRCIGNQIRLKELYGRGFKITFASRSGETERASAYVSSLLPPDAKRLDSFVTQESWEFEATPGLIQRLFEEIEAHKHEHGIDDWGLSQTTLEEVFLRIIQDTDADA
ncbi:hypothetical protein BGW38_005680 [Lunasporangiospora selenospora]|uniref:ABC transporter domain-containing protein n=1 Tax=Lunasporangiospora selenospora TaxID=979761 RepID=A0A9P6KIQ4_9FUNG|nr:hypothetical protein BGW38_005680 [Lunasporangiospora selenospora]